MMTGVVSGLCEIRPCFYGHDSESAIDHLLENYQSGCFSIGHVVSKRMLTKAAVFVSSISGAE